jgi:hypothetical protein
MQLPAYSQAHVASADLTGVQPTEYRADLVVLLSDGAPVYGIVAAMQLSCGTRLFTWPVYATTLRAPFAYPADVHRGTGRYRRTCADASISNEALRFRRRWVHQRELSSAEPSCDEQRPITESAANGRPGTLHR